MGEMASSKYYNYPAGQAQQIKGGRGVGERRKGEKQIPIPSLFSLVYYPPLSYSMLPSLAHIFSANVWLAHAWLFLC